MPVRIDEPRQHHTPVHVGPPVELVRPLVMFLQQLGDLARRRHQQPGEVDHLAVVIERDAVDVVDQRVGKRGGREKDDGKGGDGSPDTR